MKTKSIGEFREPYIRGPHLRYFFLAVLIAFIVATVLVGAFILFMRLCFPFD